MRIYIGDGPARVYLAKGIEAREIPVFESFAGEGLVDLQEFCRGDYAQAVHRGNLRHETVFSVEREFESDEAAAEHQFRHAMELQGENGTAKQGTFVFVAETSTGEASFHLKHAALQSVTFGRGDRVGVSVRATYRIVGGRIDLTP